MHFHTIEITALYHIVICVLIAELLIEIYCFQPAVYQDVAVTQLFYPFLGFGDDAAAESLAAVLRKDHDTA